MARYVILGVIVFALLLAIYVAADRYLRWDTRRRLEHRHATGEPGRVAREDYVQKGLAEYERSPEKKALLGIFLVPFAIIALLALFLN